MKRITAGRTTFVIAHRLAILRDCDRILMGEGLMREVRSQCEFALSWRELLISPQK